MEKLQLYTVSAYTENRPGVLHRVATAFTKRKINIESLTVSETSEEGLSLFTITAYIPDDVLPTIVKQLNRVVEVKKAFSRRDADLLFREAALIRVKLSTAECLSKIEAIVKDHSASVFYVDDDTAVVQTFGTEDQTRVVYRLLEPFQVLQFVRTGRIALKKQFESVHVK